MQKFEWLPIFHHPIGFIMFHDVPVWNGGSQPARYVAHLGQLNPSGFTECTWFQAEHGNVHNENESSGDYSALFPSKNVGATSKKAEMTSVAQST